MPLDFERQAQKGNKFLKDVAKELSRKTDRAQTGKIVRAVFKALRAHLTLEENFKLLSQLPLALKGTYVDQWMPVKKRDVSRRQIDFIEEVLKYEDRSSLHSVIDIQKGKQDIYAVLKTLSKHVSPGEFKKLETALPGQIRKLLKESISKKTITLNLSEK